MARKKVTTEAAPEVQTVEQVEVVASAEQVEENAAVEESAAPDDNAATQGTQAATKAAPAPKPTSPEFEVAAKAVSVANARFLEALDDRCKLTGQIRVNESCNIRKGSPELEKLGERIKAARASLEALLEQRRALIEVTPELEEINKRIAHLRKEREKARILKKHLAEKLGR